MKTQTTDLLKLAARNVWLNARQSRAALLALAAGFVALAVFQGYIKDVEQMYEDTFARRGMLGDLVIERENGADLSPADQAWLADRLNKADGVTAWSRFLKVTGTLSNGASKTVFVGYGYDLESGAKLRGETWGFNALAGLPLEQAVARQPQLRDSGLVIGKGLAQVLDCEWAALPGRRHALSGYPAEERAMDCPGGGVLQLSGSTQTGQLNVLVGQPVAVVDAVFKEVDERFVAMSLEAAQALLQTKQVSYVTVGFTSPQAARSFADSRELLNYGLRARPWKSHPFGELYVQTMELLGIFRNFVVLILLAIAGMSVLNTFLKIVWERTREIGTLRSIGFVPAQVVRLFTLEAALLAGVAALAGLVGTAVATVAMNHSGLTYKAQILSEPVPFTVGVYPEVYLVSAVFLSLVAVTAAWLPARKAARQTIATLLQPQS